MKKSILYSLLLIVCIACGGGDDGGGAQLSKDYLRVTPQKKELDSKEQYFTLNIAANCKWEITKDVDWLIVNTPTGINDQNVSVKVLENTENKDRTAILKVEGGDKTQRVEITQMKSSDTPAQKTLSVNTTSLEFEKDGGSQNITITSNTSWTITCPDWCTLSKTSGSDSATITVTVGKNEKTEKREGQIVISGEGVNAATINVSQKAGTSSGPNPGDNLPPS